MNNPRLSGLSLTTPCNNCPYRTDIHPYLTKARVREFEHNLVRNQRSFQCHKTIGHEFQNCAGSLILLHKIDQPNQIMQVAERLGYFDPSKLDMSAPVFSSFEEMEKARYDR